MNTKPKGEEMDSEYEAFVRFLRNILEARSLADIQTAAGALLQDMGEEPADE